MCGPLPFKIYSNSIKWLDVTEISFSIINNNMLAESIYNMVSFDFDRKSSLTSYTLIVECNSVKSSA